MIDWPTKFLSMVLNFTKDPGSKTLRPLMAGILAFMDTQVPIMAACHVPAVVPKAAAYVRSSRRRAEAYSEPCLTHRFC